MRTYRGGMGVQPEIAPGVQPWRMGSRSWPLGAVFGCPNMAESRWVWFPTRPACTDFLWFGPHRWGSSFNSKMNRRQSLVPTGGPPQGPAPYLPPLRPTDGLAMAARN